MERILLNIQEISMRKYGKIDENQNELVEYLRMAGAKVLIMSNMGGGCPDLLVGWRGKLTMVEVKDGKKPPSQRKLTTDQEEFHSEWANYPLLIMKDYADVEAFLNHKG
jgi:Holliday junction resolvase